MGIEDDITKGAAAERQAIERERRSAAAQAQKDAARAQHAQELWVFLNRFWAAAYEKSRPKSILCKRQRWFKNDYKTVYRDAWLICDHYTCIGRVRLWLDDRSNRIWWEQGQDLAQLYNLGQPNKHLSAEQREALESAEKQIAEYLGRYSARLGIELLPDGVPHTL